MRVRRTVGTNVLRKDGVEKVTGRAKYLDDLAFPDVLHARTIRSTIPLGDIVNIHFDFDTADFVIVDAHDIPGRNVVALIEDDQPLLAERTVRHVAEPILILAHADRARLMSAVVDVVYREATPNYDPRRSDHCFKQIVIDKGDVHLGLSEADLVIEGEYRAGHQEQLYIEPQGVVAVPDRCGGVTVYGSLQCPYYVHRALKDLLGVGDDKVRVVQTETGGGFGGKEEYPSMIAGHAAVAALKARRPVKLVYDRVEDMLATTKRHPAIIRHRTGVAKDGRLTAMEVDVVLDGGAYATLSAVVLSRGLIHASGPYRCDHMRICGRAVMTNTPPNGAFRGFGAPQTQFAVEVHLDRIADAVGLDPLRIREINALRPGDTTATGQRLGADCSALSVLRAAAKRTRFAQRRRQLRGTHRGIGLSLFCHGSGFTGSGESKLASKASLALTDRGARILVASTEIGQGTRTMLAQIAADTLGVPYEAIEVAEPDTGTVPDSGPTVASRTCMIVGRLVQRAAEDMRKRLGRLTPRGYLRKHGPVIVTCQYEKPQGISWDEETYRGAAYESYGWACDVAEVEVDPITWQVHPVRLTTVHEFGRAIHSMLAVGQIEGGSAQGVGYALLEEVVMREGRMANCQLTNYLVPTTLDTPPMDVVVFKNPYPRGPFGAKGVGELPIDGPAPAIINALRHVGIELREIPATPERVMTACILR